MKKSILFLFVSLIAFAQVNAQVNQGAIIVGGSGWFSTQSSEFKSGATTTDGPTYGYFSINPYAGFFIIDNLAVGLGIGFSSNTINTTEGEFDLTDKSSVFSVMPWARYYYVNRDIIDMWAQFGINIGFGTNTNEFVDFDENFDEFVASTETNVSTMAVGVSPGTTIMIGEKCGLSASYGWLGFSSYTEKDEANDTENKWTTFGIEWANSFGFGIDFYFNRDTR